jgi:hypothetical protein
MTSFRKILIVVFGTAFLCGCGKEGPFGNTPGPKKPEWMKSKEEAPGQPGTAPQK